MIRKTLSAMLGLTLMLCFVLLTPLHGSETRPPSARLHTVHPRDFSVPDRDGVKASLTRQYDHEAYSVASSGSDEAIVINLGWMEVAPDTAYAGRYRIRPVGLKQSANVYLMVREHSQANVRPFTPYHRTSVRRREVLADPTDARYERELAFRTRPETHALSVAIVISDLEGELHFSSFNLLDANRLQEQAVADARAEYEQLMAEIKAQANARQQLTPRTFVFSRSQMKYGLEQNYYHQWIDRPLLVNREYRVPRQGHVTPFPSYQRILQEVVKYDIDGLAFFPETNDRMGIFDLHERAEVEGIGLLPEFLGSFRPNHVEMKKEILGRALQSPHTPRIDGKLIITSYGAARLSPDEWHEVLTELREEHGDTFLFLPALTNVVGLRSPFNAGEPVSREAIEECKQYLREYLDVCDGIYFNYPAAFRNKDRTFDEAFYREMFIPVFKSVLSEPEYQNKYLGLSAYKSHMNQDRGNSLHEDHTRTLRRSFEAAMDAKPDIIILPEWDEFNENTCFRPTIYGSRTTMRILRYYMSQIKGVNPTPVPGDDEHVPNLILSARKVVTLGEDISFELLNVPDSADAEQYSAQLTLLDEAGNIVHSFDPVVFDAAKLQEYRLHIASETIPDVRALIPTLTIQDYKGEDLAYDKGFHHVQIRATWNWDYMSVKQPLRELLRPDSADLVWETSSADGGEPLILTGHVSSPEELALVEVLGDDGEVYAVDPDDEFFRNDPDRQILLIEYRANYNGNVPFEGTVSLKNATAEWLAHGTILHQPEATADADDDRIQIRSVASIHQRWIYMAVKNDDIDAAELEFDFDNARFSVPVREVFDKQMIGRAFDDGLHITIYPYRRQIDMPHHLGQKETSFRVKVWPEIATEQYHLRLTTVSGKTFRTRPLMLPDNDRQETHTLRVFSSTQQRPVDVPVAADRVPDLHYDFDPERGAVLLTSAGRPFWATLGGFPNTTTGRGAHHALFRGIYPDSIERSAPKWVEEDGRAALQFNGAGAHLTLPREAIPRRGAFTVELEVKPTSGQDQFLLVNRIVSRTKGLVLQIRNGKLHGSFRDEDWRSHSFPTDLDVPVGQWSSIRVRHDFENITFAVNGYEKSFPLTRPAVNIGFTVIGEGWRGNWFEGYIRHLRILHDVD